MPARRLFNPENRTVILTGILVLTILGIALRIDHRLNSPVTGDELYVINILTRYESFAIFFSKLPHLEFSSYLSGDYYLLYPFVRAFSNNVWGAAAPHVFSTTLCFYLLYLVGRLHLKTVVGFWIAFAVVALNSNLIFHSFELRYYAVLQTLGLGAYYLTYLLVNDRERLNRWQHLLITAYFILAILFHFYATIMTVTVITYYCAIRLRNGGGLKTVQALAPTFGAVFLVTIPILYYVLFVHFHISSDIWENETFRYIPNPMSDLVGFLKGVFCNLVGQRKLYFLWAGLFLSMVLPHKDRSDQCWFFLLLILCPIAVFLILDLAGGYWFIQRQYIWVMPLFSVLLGWCWESVVAFLFRNGPR